MSYLKNISLTQFRNYAYSTFHFHNKVTAIVGRNGCGKTNLLDSIYYLIFTKSYFQSKEINNIQNGTDGFRIVGQMISAAHHQNIVIKYKDQKKSIEEDGVKYDRISEYIGKYQAVMIAPEDLKIILDGAVYRRKFIDGILAQMDQEYLRHLLLYQKTLVQKGAYLKAINDGAPLDNQLLQVYNESLVAHGTMIIDKRKDIIADINKVVSRLYERICLQSEQIEVSYQQQIHAGQFAQVLDSHKYQEIQAGRCIYGPHLDDISFIINGQPFRNQASQGQKKSLVIALKLSQIDILVRQGLVPILLLDDIFEKLDRQRLAQFFHILEDYPLEQIFLTHTSGEEVSEKLDFLQNQIDVIEI